MRGGRALPAIAAALPAALAAGQDAPLFFRPFDGVPVAAEQAFVRVVPPGFYDPSDDDQRHLDPGGGPGNLPPDLPPRFTDERTTPSTTGMTAGAPYLGQFVDHDLTRTRLRFDELLLEPFVFRYFEGNGLFQNRRTPGLDLDPLYRISPLEYPSVPGSLGPWDLSNLRFRFSLTDDGALDFIRGNSGIAIIGDERNDETGAVGQIHRAFMLLHNTQVDRIISRDRIDEPNLEFLSDQWWDIFNEARNYTTAYYQGIVAGEMAQQLTGRTLFEALQDRGEPVGPLEAPKLPLEMAGAAFRLHTLVPTEVLLGSGGAVGPFDEALRQGVPWTSLFGPGAPPAGRLDAATAAPLRNIVNLIIPGSLIPITLDLAQVNLLRGRELTLPSGQEYLAFLLAELGHDPPPATSVVRGKLILTEETAAKILDPVEDADLLADLQSGDMDLWAYLLLEAEINEGLLGPVGQDVLERSWIGLLAADDWSLIGAHSDQFTREQMAFFQSATFDRLLSEILQPADLDRNGRVGVRDLLALLAAWGAGPSAADLDGDGDVDEADLTILLGSWGWPPSVVF